METTQIQTTFRTRYITDPSTFDPCDLDEAVSVDIESLLKQYASLIVWSNWMIAFCKQGIESPEDCQKIVDLICAIEDTRSSNNSATIQLLQTTFISETSENYPYSFLLWLVKCHCTTALYTCEFMTVTNLDALFDKNKQCLSNCGVLFDQSAPSTWTLTKLVMQLECLASHWYHLSFSHNLVLYMYVLETACAYFVTHSGDAREFDDRRWTTSVDDRDGTRRCTDAFVLYTDILTKNMKRMLFNYMCVPDSHKIAFTSMVLINGGAIEGTSTLPFTPERKAQFLHFVETTIVPMSRNEYMLRGFQETAMQYLFMVGLDEYKYFSNKLRRAYTFDLIGEFYSVTMACRMSEFIEKKLTSYYDFSVDEDPCFFDVFDYLTEVLLLYAFNSYFIGIGLEWMKHFVVFETIYMVGKTTPSGILFGSNRGDKKNDFADKYDQDSLFRHEYPVIVQRMNRFTVEFRGVVYVCKCVYVAVWLWSYFVYRRTLGVFDINMSVYFNCIFEQ